MADKYVCGECVTDYAIKEFIAQNAFSEKCSYCSNKSDEPIAAPLEEVIEFMREGLETEWDDPVNCVGWESAEGGWMGANVIDSYELIAVEIEELNGSNQAVLDDIIYSLDQEWCQRDPYGLPDDEALFLSWTGFSDQVKHHTRYIFLRQKEEEELPHDLDIIPVNKMLDRLSAEISNLEEENLLTMIKVGSKIFRTRIHENGLQLSKASEIGTVPLESAKYSNRMSPAGIPMFYGSFDSETALEETINDSDIGVGKIASIGTFSTIKQLEVLDLTQDHEIPSIFDTNRSYLRSSLIFLRNFEDEISKPIEKDGAEHIEYVPTQVFTEYIRHLYKDQSGNSLDGILYRSSKHQGGVCCVLFIQNEQCCDNYQPNDDAIPNTGSASEPCLLLEGIERRQI
ncbi:MAG: HEPN-associated N-terminal domain-containing protein [Dehalococcoides mccartyi]|nr:HEPN-associated N-terminal domain-containing protein [Dehalococcoides mccartyi]